MNELARLKKKLQCVAAASKQIARKWCLFAILTSCRARTSNFIYVIRSYYGKMDRLLTKFLQNLYTITLSSGCSCKNHNSSLKC